MLSYKLINAVVHVSATARSLSYLKVKFDKYNMKGGDKGTQEKSQVPPSSFTLHNMSVLLRRNSLSGMPACKDTVSTHLLPAEDQFLTIITRLILP